MRQPDEISRNLRERFERDFPEWARGAGTWPLRVSLHPPTPEQRSADPVACHAWSDQWRSYTGPGTIEHANLKFPTATHPMPKALTLTRPADVAAIDETTQQTWRRCGHRLTSLQRAFPEADFTGIIRRITDLNELDYQRLHDAVAWLRGNPASGLLIRQLPIEGIDTKWLAKNSHLVLRLLGDTDADPAETDPTVATVRRLRLHQRLGLRVPPDLIQVAILDPDYRSTFGGMRHLATSIDDLNQWPIQPKTVVIIENKETGYPLTDDYIATVAMHGLGCSVAHYARVDWIRNAQKVIYWGDIDLAGLQFVNDLRAHGVHATTVMMDTETLNRFIHLAVDGARPQRATLPHLSNEEHALYQRLLAHGATHGTSPLLEQERIPWQYARQVLDAAIQTPGQ